MTKENKMTEQAFTASSGNTLHIDSYGNLCIDEDVALEKGDLEPVREFFQHERDQQLGRTRWPENPDYVIYRMPESDHDGDGRCVRVLHEPTDRVETLWERWRKVPGPARSAATWYFTEGPGKPERPWEEAEPGEVWRLTVEGEEQNAVAEKSSAGNVWFTTRDNYIRAANPDITAGRKLLNADGTPADE